MDVHTGGKKAHERYLLMAQRVEASWLPYLNDSLQFHNKGTDIAFDKCLKGTVKTWDLQYFWNG